MQFGALEGSGICSALYKCTAVSLGTEYFFFIISFVLMRLVLLLFVWTKCSHTLNTAVSWLLVQCIPLAVCTFCSCVWLMKCRAGRIRHALFVYTEQACKRYKKYLP